MSKITLAMAPTFDLPVTVSQLGGVKVEITVTFKYRSVSDFNDYLRKAEGGEFKDRPDAEIVMDAATGWDLESPFTPEGIQQACNEQGSLGPSIARAYLREFMRVRQGN